MHRSLESHRKMTFSDADRYPRQEFGFERNLRHRAVAPECGVYTGEELFAGGWGGACSEFLDDLRVSEGRHSRGA